MNVELVLLALAIAIFSLTLYGTVSTPIHKTTINTSLILNESDLRAEFDYISGLPYEQYKCRQKSDMLMEYIHKKDPYHSVYTVSVIHNSKQYSHVFVVYQDIVFDPTCEPPAYKLPFEVYKEDLVNWGFNTDNRVCNGYI